MVVAALRFLLCLCVRLCQATEMVATVGFLVEKFKYGNVNFTMFDMSGQEGGREQEAGSKCSGQ